MNLLENEEQVARSKKTKTIMIIIIIAIIILLFVCAGLLYMMHNIEKEMLKVTVDGKTKTSFASDMFVFDNDNIYISIKDYAKLVGYEAYNGDHRSEDPTKCYIKNAYEEASFELNSDKMYKTLLAGTDNEYYNLQEPVKLINNKLYVGIDGMKIASNTSITYTKANNQITIYTLEYLAQYYTGKFNNAIVTGNKADFSNQKALLYNMVVVTNEEGKYGVYGIDKKEIIGTKYVSVKFIETSQDFVVTTDDNKMGIIASDGKTKIEPTYDEIKQIDKDLNLYLVKNNKKQGVINQNGNIVVYLEFDKIGIDTTQFKSNVIKNQYLLFDNCIPVQRDKKWGLYDKTGKLILPVEYDDLGCIAGTQSNKTTNNLLIVPKYEGIVVQKDKKYGLVNSLGKPLIPCVLDTIYSITTSGQDSFYMIQGENTYDVIEYIETYVIKPEENKPETNTNTTTNTVTNETTTNTTDKENEVKTNVVANQT